MRKVTMLATTAALYLSPANRLSSTWLYVSTHAQVSETGVKPLGFNFSLDAEMSVMGCGVFQLISH
jgi:hypothetical protein